MDTYNDSRTLQREKRVIYSVFAKYSTHTFTKQKEIVGRAYRGTINIPGKDRAEIISSRKKQGLKEELHSETWLANKKYNNDEDISKTLKNVIQAHGIEAARVSLGFLSLYVKKEHTKDEDGYVSFEINEILDICGYQRMRDGRHSERTRRRVGKIIWLASVFPIVTRYKTKGKKGKTIIHRVFHAKELDDRFKDEKDPQGYTIGGKFIPEPTALRSASDMLISKRILTKDIVEIGVALLLMLKIKNQEFAFSNPYDNNKNSSVLDTSDFRLLLTWNDIHEYLFAHTKKGAMQSWRNKKKTKEVLECLQEIEFIGGVSETSEGFVVYIAKNWKDRERDIMVRIIDHTYKELMMVVQKVGQRDGFVHKGMLQYAAYKHSEHISYGLPHDVIDICIQKVLSDIEGAPYAIEVVD